MTSPEQGFDVPYGALVTPEGTPTDALSQLLDKYSRTFSTIREAIDLMDDLDPVTASTNDIATAWEEFRTKLQEIG